MHVNHRTEIRQAHLPKRGISCDTGIVDHDVNSTEPGYSTGDHFSYIQLGSDVALDWDRSCSCV
jgi:hypothetical protein